MRRLIRWAFNSAGVVSALLFVGACVLWVLSFCVPISYHFSYQHESCEVVMTRGRTAIDNGPAVAEDKHRRAGGRLGARPLQNGPS